jgi:Na+-translocating ferredoxin:NAD+ oxidoreductase RnfC subunit
LRQHTGVPAIPMVSVGEQVRAGDPVAIPEKGTSGAWIHASIDGTVRSIESSIVIEAQRL